MDAFTWFLPRSIQMSDFFNASPSNFCLLRVRAWTHSKTLLCMIKPPAITVLYHFYLHFHATYKRSKISLWYKYLYASPWQQGRKKPRLNAGIQIPPLRPGSLLWINLCKTTAPLIITVPSIPDVKTPGKCRTQPPHSVHDSSDSNLIHFFWTRFLNFWVLFDLHGDWWVRQKTATFTLCTVQQILGKKKTSSTWVLTRTRW